MSVLWLKAAHVVVMVTWFSGLFYLPRLFVYHAMSDDKISQERFKVMERKLYLGITTPGGILTTLTGLGLILHSPFYLQQRWLHWKLLLVLGLWAYHLICGHFVKRFKHDKNSHSHVFYRWFNEAPVIALIGIICLAIIRPT